VDSSAWCVGQHHDCLLVLPLLGPAAGPLLAC
jgi:hypothetical protein